MKTEFTYDSILGDELLVKVSAKNVSVYGAVGLKISVENAKGEDVTNLIPSKDWDNIEETAQEELQNLKEQEDDY